MSTKSKLLEFITKLNPHEFFNHSGGVLSRGGVNWLVRMRSDASRYVIKYKVQPVPEGERERGKEGRGQGVQWDIYTWNEIFWSWCW